jgi:disulfide bond formation protein DsbB
MTIKKKFQLTRLLTILIPFICTIILITHLIFNSLGYDFKAFNYLGGTSIIVWIYFLWNSYIYNLCIYHRIYLYYIIFANSLAIIDNYLKLPINTHTYYTILFIGFGIAIIIYSYLKYKNNK